MAYLCFDTNFKFLLFLLTPFENELFFLVLARFCTYFFLQCFLSSLGGIGYLLILFYLYYTLVIITWFGLWMFFDLCKYFCPIFEFQVFFYILLFLAFLAFLHVFFIFFVIFFWPCWFYGAMVTKCPGQRETWANIELSSIQAVAWLWTWHLVYYCLYIGNIPVHTKG